MNRLNLYLSDKIKATFTRKVEDTDSFVINKDFYIHRLLCDKKEMIFKEDDLSETFLQQVLYLVKNITDNKVKNCFVLNPKNWTFFD